jgi:hypothetical protein
MLKNTDLMMNIIYYIICVAIFISSISSMLWSSSFFEENDLIVNDRKYRIVAIFGTRRSRDYLSKQKLKLEEAGAP